MFKSIAAGTVLDGKADEPRPAYARQGWRLPALGTEQLILVVSIFFTVACNGRFWSAFLAAGDYSRAHAWLLVLAVFALVTALHCFLLGLVVTRRTAKPLLSIVLLTTAATVYYMNRYTVFMDTTMLRNLLHTDVKEARELLSFSTVVSLTAYGILPSFLLWKIRLKPAQNWRRAAFLRTAFLFSALFIVLASIGLFFQDLSALMRNQKEVRYLVTPANYIVSLARVVAAESGEAQGPRLPVAPDAVLAAGWAQRDKPVLLVLVVGETARAANWGLNGYARQTTPELAAAGVINFPQVVSCGTNTETSLPCMFSPYGRANYDEKKIRQHESLLHVLARAGFRVIWRDNQSGCKGVCDGLEVQQTDAAKPGSLCNGERCLDEALLEDLETQVRQTRRNTVVVLHQLGNHGPAYFRRYPPAFDRFAPGCNTDDLGLCAQQEIINSYDNALLYTDHFLAETIHRLGALTDRDSAMLYVSDHGESLGENGIYLHGLPYAIAPQEQKRVPMVMWMSEGFTGSLDLVPDCLRREAGRPVSHDYLFHSVLGMLQVSTGDYDRSLDFTAACRLDRSRTATLKPDSRPEPETGPA